MSLTQYLESQEDQDMTSFTRTQERRREGGGGFVCLEMKERGGGGLYSSGGENMNGRSFNEG